MLLLKHDIAFIIASTGPDYAYYKIYNVKKKVQGNHTVVLHTVL